MDPCNEILSARERNQLVINITAWVNLKINMPNERSQTEKSAHYIIPLM